MIQSHYMIANAPRRQPLYVQIKQFLLRRIAEGEWLEHDALPSEWDLADEMSVSQGTVRKALRAGGRWPAIPPARQGDICGSGAQ
jgi:GntR family transcriptional regulator